MGIGIFEDSLTGSAEQLKADNDKLGRFSKDVDILIYQGEFILKEVSEKTLGGHCLVGWLDFLEWEV